jgi:hypothetical protein
MNILDVEEERTYIETKPHFGIDAKKNITSDNVCYHYAFITMDM